MLTSMRWSVVAVVLGTSWVACAPAAPPSKTALPTEALPTQGPAPSELVPTEEPRVETPPETGVANGPAPTPIASGPTPVENTTEEDKPIACKSAQDCWVDDDGNAIARPKNKRGVTLKPCKGAERTPACEDKVCVVKVWKC